MELTATKNNNMNNIDPMLQTASQTARSSSQSAAKSGDKKSEFGNMVRQRQRDTRDAKDAKQADSSQSGNGQVTRKNDSQTPVKDEQEITNEQYAIAAAMMLQPALDLLMLNIKPEEQEGETDIAPILMQDIRIEAVTDMPIEATAESGQQALFENQDDKQSEKFDFQITQKLRIHEETAFHGIEEEQDEIIITEDINRQTPVFGYMDAAPVKVASARETPIPLETEEGVEQLGMRLERLLIDPEGANHVEFTLIPASLGKVSVHITQGIDGSLHIQLSATTTKAAEILQKNSDGLQKLLGADTRPNVKIEVRTSDEGQALYYLNPDANQDQQNQRQNQNQRNQNRRRNQNHAIDFVQQLRLGLVGLENAV